MRVGVDTGSTFTDVVVGAVERSTIGLGEGSAGGGP